MTATKSEPTTQSKDNELLGSSEQPRQPETVISIQKLIHRFPNEKQPTLDVVKLEVKRGEVVIMTGPSGSGKTTLLTLIGGLRKVQKGSLRVLNFERELKEMNDAELVRLRKRIGFIFQAHNLFDSLTALQNVRMALELGGRSPGEMPSEKLSPEKSSSGKMSPEEMDEEAIRWLHAMHIGDTDEEKDDIHKKPGSLSGGMRQRVAIARALASKPELILADEPTAALNGELGKEIVRQFQTLAHEEGITFLIVTHDNRLNAYADRFVHMEDGRIVSNELVNKELAIAAGLYRCPLFAKMRLEEVKLMAGKATLERHKANDLIIEKNTKGDKFYVIRQGKVRVSEIGNRPGLETVVLKEGDYFGEIALVTGEERNANVRAIEDVETYVLTKEHFDKVRFSNPELHTEILREIEIRKREGAAGGTNPQDGRESIL